MLRRSRRVQIFFWRQRRDNGKITCSRYQLCDSYPPHTYVVLWVDTTDDEYLSGRYKCLCVLMYYEYATGVLQYGRYCTCGLDLLQQAVQFVENVRESK